MKTETATTPKPTLLNRIRSRQSGLPSGLLGRIFGRLMIKSTAPANDRAIEQLELTQPSTVLEVGYGQGRTAQLLLAQGHSVLGVEASSTMKSQASARNRQACRDGRAQLKVGDGTMIPFATASADVAITVHTIYFMTDPQGTLNEVARVLKPDGRFVMACRSGDDQRPAWMDPEIYRIPTVEQIETMLTSAGFVEVTREPADAANNFTNVFRAHRVS